jgi:hypothetical protein
MLFVFGELENFPINTIHLVNNIISQEIHYYFIAQILSKYKKNISDLLICDAI